jgi:chemotaxis family two-component system response regulator Rcp1
MDISILLIEDSLDDIEIAEIAFTQSELDIELKIQKNGAAAIAYMKSLVHFPDLIILDWNLPLISGSQVLSFLKCHEQFRRIPVIILTTSRRTEDIDEAYANHCNAYAIKPLDLEETIDLLKKIATFFGKNTILPTRI